MQSVQRSNTHPDPSRPENRNMNAKTTRTAALTVTLALASVSHHAIAQDAEDLAKKLSNPKEAFCCVKRFMIGGSEYREG